MKLLEHFKELSIYPENAKELKGLILQLAIQGKLTAQWRAENKSLIEDEDNAKALLERIQTEKAQLIKEKKIKKEKALPPISKEEIPFELPIGWEWCRLGDVGYTQTGSTPSKKDVENYGNYIPFLGPANISNEKMEYPSEGLSEIGLNRGRLIPNLSLMMVCIGGSIGKCNVNEKDVSCNQQINTISPLILPVLFVKIVCQSKYFQDKVWGKSSGSATPIINKGKWESILIPFPPLAEQKAIVEIVDNLVQEIEVLQELTQKRVQLKEDFITSALRRLSEGELEKEWGFLQQHFSTFMTEESNVKRLRECILQLAVQGKLTKQWRAENSSLIQAEGSAKCLLEQIQAEKAQLIKEKKIKKEKALPPITKDEIPYELPEGWEWCRMIDISEKLGAGSTPSGGKAAYVDEGIMFFRSQNVYNDGLRTKEIALIPEKTHEKMKGTKIKPKDLLLNITGGSIGRCALVPDDFVTGNVSQHVAIVRLIELDLRKYIHQLMISPQFQKTIMDVQVGVSREGLSMTKLKQFLVPIPTLSEQQAIVTKVNELMALCDTLEQEIVKNKEATTQLMQSVLREVFQEKAVEQTELLVTAES